MDDRVLHVERVARDDALDQVLLAEAVQRQAEAAAETVPPSAMKVLIESFMFWLPGKAASPVVGKPRVSVQASAPGP